MLKQIKGLHHVTSMAADAQTNNAFFTHTLGLRRVKKTVNFDAPDVYHLYYGDEIGTPGTVMTYFPFPHIARGRRGAGEVGETQFAVSPDSLPYWKERLEKAGSAKPRSSARRICASSALTATASRLLASRTTSARPSPRDPCLRRKACMVSAA